MVVITLTDCPVGLRGDLTKWLLEINSGVFVGQISARVRDKLWDKICNLCKNGRAVMVYGAANEQGLDFKTIGSAWEPVDFEGIKLMLRPSPSRLKLGEGGVKKVYSKAAHLQAAKRADKAKTFPKSYVVVDVETTGLDSDTDEIIEIGAIKIRDGVIIEELNIMIKPERPVPQKIEILTGITNQILEENGHELKGSLQKFLRFVGTLPVVAHNAGFDYAFLRHSCKMCELPLFSNRYYCTLELSKRMVKGVENYKLITLIEYFGIESNDLHRSKSDCLVTQKLYENLINLMSQE